MKRILLLTILTALVAPSIKVQAQPATLKLTDVTLMHEMRATPSPLPGAVVTDRAVSFQWPLAKELSIVETGMDGMDGESALAKVDKTKIRYALRYSQDPTFKKGTVQTETRWPFFNPEQDLEPGVWHWQYGYVVDGKTQWATTQHFTIEAHADKFCPPAFKELIGKLPANHPRVFFDKNDWDSFILRTTASPDRKTYIDHANKALKTPMKSVDDINTSLADKLNNPMMRGAMLTRESRRIIDAEEANADALIRAYVLTKEARYADEAIRRVKTMATWGDNPNVVGDFNDATLMSLCSAAYDIMYDLLDADTRRLLLATIKNVGNKMYRSYNNHLENHIADNHVLQMTLRIFTMAAFTTYGHLPEAELWVDYCYNVWIARFPGVNKDGAWHNGDSYFQVNFRTLIEVPYFYSRISGFDFFADPWYQGNALYTIYHQPPFSKSAGNGNSHQNKLTPHGVRVSYADALARLTGNTFAADYVRCIQAKQPNILTDGSLGKAGGLAWFRLQCNKPLPEGPGIADLPMGYVFPASGLATFSTNLPNTKRSAMISFRSSPYGSTSHALANQNAFNTFWAGQSIFYSSGHHTAFVDKYDLLCHRGARAHNTILVNGMGQRIGTEGYGWIPRHYVGEKIGYVVGDASNAYGPVISELWLKRAQQADVQFTPQNGWDEVGLKTFRRHIVELGKSGLSFVYDELEATHPVAWSYLLHTVTNPMSVDKTHANYIHIEGTSKNGVSDAFLFAADKLEADTTSQFFVPADNWLIADANGKFEPNANHWHFTATSAKHKVFRFATIISTHAKVKEGGKPAPVPQVLKDGRIKIGSWVIKVNITAQGVASFNIRNTRKDEDVSISYRDGQATVVREDSCETTLTDKMPELEI